jgi:hypothetical protein
MKLLFGIGIALVSAAIFLQLSYKYGFMAGVETEKESIEAAKLAINHGNQKLYQCNQIIMRNCGTSIGEER